ncbi:MAG TPA: putative molybdenum carrier protein [Verrucomicrobiae bacterium]
MNAQPAKILSGGQTGADRAALDWATRRGIPHGGYCPKGRKAEDGIIPDCYALVETESTNYLERTELNAFHSDATVIFTISAELQGGSLRTAGFAKKHGKPWLHISATHYTPNEAAKALRGFVQANRVGVLNVAGSRGSKEPKVSAFVEDVLDLAIE